MILPVPTPSEELDELAKRVIESIEAHKDQDIEEWAQRLANCVINADD